MNDTSKENNPRDAERSRSGRMLRIILIAVVLGAGAAVFWANYGQLGAPSRTAAEPAAQPQAAPSPQVEVSDETIKAVKDLEQSVKDLQASQQHTADQLENIQRQLASEQGERKLLSNQVGVLAGRVDGLSAAVTTGTTSQQPLKKKPVSR